MRSKWLKRSIASVLAFSMILTPVPAKAAKENVSEKRESSYNYAQAFQKSLYFYDANMCGIQDGRLSYRGDCHMEDAQVPLIPKTEEGIGTNMSQSFIDANKGVLDPDGDGTVDLQGGFHDAGDHVKFGLPQSYSASTLGWSYYEFKDSYVKTGEQEHIESILRHFTDYFLRSTFRDKNGEVVAFCYQVGDGSTDHNYWGAPELQTTARPVWFATSEEPASDQCAGAAAALATSYLNFKESDPEYAQTCLDTAIALYDFAVANRGCGFSGGFYNSSYDDDEMSWAAVWLNICTGKETYIDDICHIDEQGNYTGYMKQIIKTTSSTWQNIWVHSWDTVWGGVFAKLAPVTNDPLHWYIFRWNIEYWSGVKHENPADTTYLEKTPAGFSVISTWGSARYNAAAQMCALVYNKYDKKPEFVDWAKSQMDYILGDNPMHRCYEVGYAENSAVEPHHRASHASLTNSMEDPVDAKHTLWGALVGGPDFDDYHEDDRTNYVYNEVAIDYNAGFVGALAGIYEQYGEGQETLKELPQDNDEHAFFVEGKMEQENKERTQLTIRITNDTACYPRRVDNLKARYFFDISEMVEKGQSIKDLKLAVMYDEALIADQKATKINGPFAWDEENNIYYVELDWTGDGFHGDRELHFALVPNLDSNWKPNWDPTNDYSREGIGDEFARTDKITLYEGDKLVWGTEPVRGEVRPVAEASVAGTQAGDELDFTAGITPVTLNAVVQNSENVAKVEFYVNDEKVGTAAKAPYSVTYKPVQTGGEETKDLVVTAKAITNSGAEVTSKSYKVIARFVKKQAPVIAITSPKEGTVLDTAKGNASATIVVTPVGDETISSISVYADGTLIGKGDADGAKVVYTVPEGYAQSGNGTSKVVITAKATLASGKSVSCEPVTITVKQPVNPDSVPALALDVTGKGVAKETTIQRRYTLTNSSNKDIDLSKVTIRYYYTKEADVSQVLYVDSAGMQLDSAPWYVDATKNVTSTFETVSGNDSYCDISFAGLDTKLPAGKNIAIDARIANDNWSAFDQTNDYSYAGGDTICVYYDGVLVSGVEQ
ncbi:glycoside hydrolase family 9 protein [[Clostridium] polysaccharolyticum]|uniref:Cellulose binding domain-containing protein n=1 Tax=[Clostridium] polysaccharolyticum TaxID=29364 RepID=A0A1H9ZQP6_9FIRM|nr:glycoside hydrolase family 9 protein [[Clostridium] polysaccharolyticum]SES83142.1 Cellulose binding domain-containing protein [[Clostridium] polysaccharolyticum]